jgi:hypothetical protein
MWKLLYRFLGPATVEGAIQGCSTEAHESWKRDLERRRAYTREQRARRAAARTEECKDWTADLR